MNILNTMFGYVDLQIIEAFKEKIRFLADYNLNIPVKQVNLSNSKFITC